MSFKIQPLWSVTVVLLLIWIRFLSYIIRPLRWVTVVLILIWIRPLSYKIRPVWSVTVGISSQLDDGRRVLCPSCIELAPTSYSKDPYPSITFQTRLIFRLLDLMTALPATINSSLTVQNSKLVLGYNFYLFERLYDPVIFKARRVQISKIE